MVQPILFLLRRASVSNAAPSRFNGNQLIRGPVRMLVACTTWACLATLTKNSLNKSLCDREGMSRCVCSVPTERNSAGCARATRLHVSAELPPCCKPGDQTWALVAVEIFQTFSSVAYKVLINTLRSRAAVLCIMQLSQCNEDKVPDRPTCLENAPVSFERLVGFSFSYIQW